MKRSGHMQILGKIGNYLKNFFNSMECFRFVLFGALFFGIERVSNITMGIIMLWSMYLFIYKLIIKKGIQRIRYTAPFAAFSDLASVDVQITEAVSTDFLSHLPTPF